MAKRFANRKSHRHRGRKKKDSCFSAVTVEDRKLSNVIDIKKFSKLQKLLRVTTWVMRFIRNLKAKRLRNERDMYSLSVKEINGAEIEWIKDTQKSLTEKDNFEKQKKSLGIYQVDGILVCKGRLENSDYN